MKILVTGAAGFIGFHLCKKLINSNFQVIGIDNLNEYYEKSLKIDRLNILEDTKKFSNLWRFYKVDLSNMSDLDELCEKNKPEIIINLAAQAGVRYSLERPEEYIKSNLVGFGNILECCKKHNIGHLIYASSSSVYGGNKKLPFSEVDGVNHPVSIYAATKRANELMAHTYSHLYNLPTTGLRFFTVYGPWGRPDMAYFIFISSIIKGEPIKIFNNGEMRRDFTYIDDVIDGIMNIINKKPNRDPNFDFKNPNPATSFSPYRIFNIGNASPIKLMQFVDEIESALGKKAKKIFLPIQPGDVEETAADISALNKWTGFKPKTSLKEGIRKFAEWYRRYYQ